MTMEISIVIPTLNEGALLPGLLQDLQRQTLQDFEVIVADAGSYDGTEEIARAYGAIVTPGGLPAAGRNRGAALARGTYLFFLDADVRLPETFLEAAHAEMEARYLDLATCAVVPMSTHPVDRLLYDFANLAVTLGQFTDPHAPGFCLLITRRLFRRVGGFDETLKMAEDHNLVRRASVFRPLRVLKSTQVSVSVRRIEKEGRAGLVSKYLRVELYRVFVGEIRKEIFEYEFGAFTDEELALVEAKVQEGQKLSERISKEYSNLVSSLGIDTLTQLPAERLANIKEQFGRLKEQVRSILTVRRR